MAALSQEDLLEMECYAKELSDSKRSNKIVGAQPLIYFGRIAEFGKRRGSPDAEWCDEETRLFARRILRYHQSSPVSDAEKLCAASVTLYNFFVGGLYITRPRTPSVSDGDGYYLGHQGCVLIFAHNMKTIKVLCKFHVGNQKGEECLQFLQPLNRSHGSVHHAADVERAFAAFRNRQWCLPPRTFEGDYTVERPDRMRSIGCDEIKP